MSNRDIAAVINNQEAKAIVVADSSEPKSIDELRLCGLTVIGAVRGADSVNYGIKAVQNERISLTKRSVDTIKEYRNFLWRTDKNGKILQFPEEGNDHSMDGIRYAITSLIIPPPKKGVHIHRSGAVRVYGQTNRGQRVFIKGANNNRDDW